ncbi:MAG: sugar kinase [Sphingomonas sp.]|nr:MAG: sugar kinase [Sphingomonas sp.]
MAGIVVVGEGMVELAPDPDAGGWRVGQGGDTLNTALHLARLGGAIGFLTALGTDPFSLDLRGRWSREGLDPTLVLTDPVRRPGLYAITNDADGERHFTYWRGESAARHLFDMPGIDAAMAVAETADLLVFSLISVAILPADGRERLFDLATRIRARGGRVAFDTNFRPALWPDLVEARAAHARAMALADIGLPTLEDEAALIGTGDPASILARWHAAGVAEVVVKTGPEGCVVDGVRVPPPARLSPVDTSGAGDAFNAGYLHARLAGAETVAAARAGHRLAAWVVMNRGAVPAVGIDSPYASLAAGRAGELA